MAERNVPPSQAKAVAAEIVFMGPPGVGKGTQAKRLQQNLGWIQLSTGELFRDHIRRATELGALARSFMNKGEYVPDDVTVRMVEGFIDSLPAGARVMFDGFPRTIEQAQDLDRLLEKRGRRIGKVLLLTVPRDELVRRIVARSRSEGRADDTPEVMARRFDVYKEQPRPVVDFYASKGLVAEIDGAGEIDEVTARLMQAARTW